MRMWMVDPKLMCTKHLIGEHLETHMLAGSVKLEKKMNGYLKNGIFEPASLKQRHDDLVKEMLERGFQHFTPFTEVDFPEGYTDYFIDKEWSANILFSKCKLCNALKEEHSCTK